MILASIIVIKIVVVYFLNKIIDILEQRGKKKKKKKAILKLLILGAVLKAKIGTLLQILSFKLQVNIIYVDLNIEG